MSVPPTISIRIVMGLDARSILPIFLRVLRKLSHWLVVCALVFSIGAHWALLQTVAWVGMAVSYAHNSTLSEALLKTFDGQHPCKLCNAVAEGKKSEQKQTPQKPITKIDLFCLPSSLPLKRPSFLPVPVDCRAAIFARGERPPYPPPRQTPA